MSINRFAPVLLAVAITASGLFGCSARQSPRPAPTTPQGATQLMPRGTTPGTPQGFRVTPNNMVNYPKNMATSPQKTVTAPKQLATIHSNALGIMADAERRDWTSVHSRMRLMRTSYNQMRPLMQATSVPTHRVNALGTAIDRLEKQVAARNSYETRLQANKVTKAVPDVAETYKTTIPADLSRLGYLTREMALNVEKNDWTAANTNLSSAKTMWSGLYNRLGTSPGNTHKDGITRSLDGLGKAIASKSSASVRTGAKGVSDAVTAFEAYLRGLNVNVKY